MRAVVALCRKRGLLVLSSRAQKTARVVCGRPVGPCSTGRTKTRAGGVCEFPVRTITTERCPSGVLVRMERAILARQGIHVVLILSSRALLACRAVLVGPRYTKHTRTRARRHRKLPLPTSMTNCAPRGVLELARGALLTASTHPRRHIAPRLTLCARACSGLVCKRPVRAGGAVF